MTHVEGELSVLSTHSKERYRNLLAGSLCGAGLFPVYSYSESVVLRSHGSVGFSY